ncbi:MAG: tetratricopeptide repeat protein [Spirochaetaceae bacterium]
MSNRPHREEERTLQQRFIEFLSRYRAALLTILVLIVVGIVGSFLYLEISDRRATEAANLAEELRTSYQEWLELEEEGDQEEKSTLKEEIDSTASEILDRYGNTFAAQRAHFVLAGLAWENENYEEAASRYALLAEEFPRSYLAPVALFNAAIAQEELGNPEEAEVLYQRLVEEYADSSAQVPRALFALGRLSESADAYEEAASYYNRILDEYGESSWTTLARNRIIFLQTEELISESS